MAEEKQNILPAGLTLEKFKRLSEEDQEEINRLIFEHEKQIKMNPASTYVPNLAAEQLITAVGNDTKHWIFVVPAANSLGKTCCAINILINVIYGPQNEWFKGTRYESWEGPKKAWYISEHSALREMICGIDENAESEMKKWFPAGRYHKAKANLDYFSSWVADNGWSATFKTYDQEQAKFEAEKISLAIFDEPPPEPIYNATIARMTLGGIIILVMTPLHHAAWVMDRLVSQVTDSPEQSAVWVLPPKYADIEFNCRDHSPRGRLSHERITQIANQYDEEEREARTKGSFMHLSGLVFRGLHPDLHRHDFPPESFHQEKEIEERGPYQILNVVDPHDQKPPAIIWAAVDKYENVWIADEFPNEPFHLMKGFQRTTKDVCEIIKQKEISNGWNPKKIIRIMDPNFGRKPVEAVGRRVYEQFAICGRELKWPLFYSTNVDDDLASGHRAIRDAIQPNADGAVKLKVGRNAWNCWYGLTHYSRKLRVGKRLDVDGPGEAVAEKHSDFPACLRYLFAYLRGPRIVEPQPEVQTYDALIDEKIFKPIRQKTLRKKSRWENL